MILSKINDFFSNTFKINSQYTTLIIYSLILALVFKGFSILLNLINQKIPLNEKQIYTTNKRNKTILAVIFIISLAAIWKDVFPDFMTFITFMSAAITLAVRDIIFNYFCGLYIKLTKSIKIEDRIQIGDHTGDIVNINNLNFELLEVDNNTNQSTGIIIHFPNSFIFTSPIKNYNKGFKYIWDELQIRIDINSDVNLAQETLLKITSSNPIVKEIPKKMKQEMHKSVSEYRIYYNNLTPIVYTEIKDGLIYLNVRFLIHPKKQRIVENDIYTNILKTFKQNNIIIK